MALRNVFPLVPVDVYAIESAFSRSLRTASCELAISLRLRAGCTYRQGNAPEWNVDVRNDKAELDHLFDVPGIVQSDVEVFARHDALRDGRVHVVVHVDRDPVLARELRYQLLDFRMYRDGAEERQSGVDGRVHDPLATVDF